jgi:hypothetical protein
VPHSLLNEAQAQGRKRKLANIHMPPTPANWKRAPLSMSSAMKMNNTIETPTPSKRLKILAESRADTGHSITFTTPNETPSAFGASTKQKNMIASAVKRNMDKLLQDIEEENVEINPDVTLMADNSPGFGSEISSISPYETNPVATLRKEVSSSIKSPSFLQGVLRSNVNSLNTTNLNNATLIDVSTLSPMIRKITDQVGKQFQQCFRYDKIF